MGISARNIINACYGGCRRFPASVCMLVIMVFFAICCNHYPTLLQDGVYFFLIFYPATTALLCISLKLWQEEENDLRRRVILQAVAHVVWLVACLYFSSKVPFDANLPVSFAIAAAVLSIVLSCWLLSFYKAPDDTQLWNFMWHTTVSVVVCAGIALALFIALGILIHSFRMLFGLIATDKVFSDVFILCFGLLAPLLFMQLIPAGDRKHDGSVHTNRFLNGVTHYLVVPLVTIYVLTLYVYAIKVLIRWQLPDGWVSTLVTVLMALMLIVIFLMYPTRNDVKMRFNRVVLRWLPVVVLPLLVFMTIGVARRLVDYGVTVFRLYLALFNLWCYVVCIVLIATRCKRFGWIISSFALAFLLFSVGPWSMGNVTRYCLQKQVKSALVAAGCRKLPLGNVDYSRCMKQLPPDKALAVNSKLLYLRDNYGSEATARLVDSHVSLESVIVNDSLTDDTFYTNYDFDQFVDIPEKVSKVKYVTQSAFFNVNGGACSFTVSADDRQCHFKISTATLHNMEQAAGKMPLLLKSQEGNVLCVYRLRFDRHAGGSGIVEGLLFI